MKNSKALILLLIANVISGIAQGISMIAIPWFFAMQLKLDFFVWFYIAANVVAILWVPYCGTLIDKYNRKKIFLWINAISAVILGLVSGIGFFNGFLPLLIVAFVFVMTMANYSIHYPCIYAFIQEIIPQKLYGKVTSILEVQGQATNILGGALAAFLLEGTKDGKLDLIGFQINAPFDFAAWKIHEIFLLDMTTYIVAFFIIALIKYVPLVEREEENASLKERLKIGWNFLMENKTTFLFGVVSYIVFVCVLLEAFYLGALYVKSHLLASGSVYASSDITYSLGAIISGLAIRKIFKNYNIPQGIIILFLLTFVVFIILGFTNSVNVYFLMLFFMGLSNAGTRILRVTYLFNNIPNQVFGRAASIFNIANIFLRIVLLLLFAMPFFHLGNNVIYAFLILSVVLLIATGVLLQNYKKFDLNSY